jgi:histone-lysine N-methyltransferase SETMAR
VEEDRRVTIKSIALANGVSVKTVHDILHKDLGLVKKSARWAPRLLNADQKKERVRTCQKFLAAVQRRSMAMLDNIVTMDESAVSFHTPETKQQSKQWLPKGQPGPIKAKVQASRTKQMVLAFFDAKGIIYTNYAPRGTTVNANYIVEALGKFMKVFRKKRPIMAEGQWFFHWDNALVHTATVVRDWLAARQVQMIDHPPYSPDLAPADFFLFPKLKMQLAGLTLTQDTFKNTWEGVIRTLSKEDFATAFRRWYERCEKCIEIGGNYVEKT